MVAAEECLAIIRTTAQIQPQLVIDSLRPAKTLRQTLGEFWPPSRNSVSRQCSFQILLMTRPKVAMTVMMTANSNSIASFEEDLMVRLVFSCNIKH